MDGEYGHEDMREMNVMIKMSGQAIWRDEEMRNDMMHGGVEREW